MFGHDFLLSINMKYILRVLPVGVCTHFLVFHAILFIRNYLRKMTAAEMIFEEKKPKKEYHFEVYINTSKEHFNVAFSCSIELCGQGRKTVILKAKETISYYP